jgi:predicted kinase
MRLILTRGLPASGKTTWAEKFIEDHPDFININRDDQRLSLVGRKRYKKWGKWRESIVTEASVCIAGSALAHGKSVIISDCNLNPIRYGDWEELAEHFKCEVEFEDQFLRVPYGVCIERDAKREFPVGQQVIERMYNAYKHLYWKDERDKQKQHAIICDLDGTLADISHRSPYDASKCFDDGIIEPVWDMVETYITAQPDTELIFMSGREDTHEDWTRRWLDDKCGFGECYHLYMRDAGDNRPDYVVKEEMYRKYITPYYYVKFAIDDRNQIVHLWRHLGIPTFQVNYGYF